MTRTDKRSKRVFFMMASLHNDALAVTYWLAMVATLRGNTEKPAENS